jgi:glutathione-regulated potassium-efflux system ancillary protein KefG
LEGKEVYILVTGGKERSFSKTGTYQYSIDELISGLIVSLKVFKADIRHIKIVYEANKLSKKKLFYIKKNLQNYSINSIWNPA